jgi:hypothetical protein
MTTLSFGEWTAVPEQRPKPKMPNERKIAPWTRNSGAVESGTGTKSEPKVEVDARAARWSRPRSLRPDGARDPRRGMLTSSGFAARIRAGVQKAAAFLAEADFAQTPPPAARASPHAATAIKMRSPATPPASAR